MPNSKEASKTTSIDYKNIKQDDKEEKVRGYIPRNCDFKCYKCRYQGVCIIPRRLIEHRKRYTLGIQNKNDLLNRKYGLNNFNSIFGLYYRFFRPIVNILSRLNKKSSRYRKKSKYEE